MRVFRSISEVQSFSTERKSEGKRLGFVPTMGALHDGHLSLLRQAKKENDIVICSIFVNPIQFNDKKDLENYPRDLDTDIKLLEAVQCDALFAPEEEEIFPQGEAERIHLGKIEQILEGEFRPGHFSGVATVVKALFKIVQPDKAYFGLKDYQQFAVIQLLVKSQNLGVEVVGCETQREENGLAMSSRNRLLSDEALSSASIFYESLLFAKSQIRLSSPEVIKTNVQQRFDEKESFSLEYFEIVDAEDLEMVENIRAHNSVIACIAGYVEGVRLIDNLILIP